MVVLADEILESFFETDLSASFKLELVPDLELPTSSGGFLEDLWSNIATEDNKKIFHKISDELGKTIGKHQVIYRPRIGRYTKLEEPRARESLVSPASKSTLDSSDALTTSQSSSSMLTIDAIAAQDSGPGSVLSSVFSPMPHVKAVNAAFMERTPFAIDDAGDDDDDSDLDMVHGEDDDQVMDEVDAFLEAHESGLTDADKEAAKGEHRCFVRTERCLVLISMFRTKIFLTRSPCDGRNSAQTCFHEVFLCTFITRVYHCIRCRVRQTRYIVQDHQGTT